MGWASGSELAERIWKKFGKKDKKLCKILYEEFCYNDADDWEFEEGSLYYCYLKWYNKEEFDEYMQEYGIDWDE